MSRILPLLLASLLLLTACGTPEPAAPQVVIALIDLSGSTAAVREQYLAQTRQIMESLPAGSRFLALPVSLTVPALADTTFPTYTWWATNSFTHGREMRRLRQEAMAEIEAGITQAAGSSGTHILDSLREAEKFLAGYPDGAGAVYILSDMVEQSDLIDFYNLTADGVIPALAKVQEDRALPNLHGASVTVAGLEAASTLKPSTVRAIQSFWEEIFQQAGATLRRYSPTLQVDSP